MTVPELQARFATLRNELSDIDEQLGTRTGQGEEFRTWRRHAIHSKQLKTRELIAVKRQLFELQARTPDASSTKFWRGQAVRLVRVIEEIVLDPELPNAVAIKALEVLSAFRHETTERREGNHGPTG